MNNLHYDINELEQQYTIYCQVLDQYTNQLEDKLNELKSFVDDDSSTSITLSVLKESVNRQVIINLEKIIEIFSQIKLKLNQVKEYYLSCCGEMSLDENDLIDNIKCVKQIISYYEDLEHSLHLTPEVNAQQDVAQILDQLHQLNNLYQNKIDSMYEFEQTIVHMFDNEIEELREIQLNMSELKALGANELIFDILSIKAITRQTNTPPNPEDFGTYEDYLNAVAVYASSKGLATTRIVNGVMYYEFNEKFKMSYYGEQLVDTQLIIITDGDKTDVYMKYYLNQNTPVICVPNGMLVTNTFTQAGTNDNPIYESGKVIGEAGNYQDFFTNLFSGEYDPENQIIDTVNWRSENYDKLNDSTKAKVNGFVNTHCDTDYVTEFAANILAYDSSGGIKSHVTKDEIENQAKMYVVEGQDFGYFAGEIEMHAEGVQNDKNLDLWAARGIYGIFGKDKDYDEAMKNADMAKSDYSYELREQLQYLIIDFDYAPSHRKNWVEKWKKYSKQY